MATSKMEDGSTGEFSMIEINIILEYSIWKYGFECYEGDVSKEFHRSYD
jgi:hypothetical protein